MLTKYGSESKQPVSTLPTSWFARACIVNAGATQPRGQYGLGAEFAGTVDAIGVDVSGFVLGDEVIGTQERLDVTIGAQAEFIVVDTFALAPAPAGKTMVEAACLPLPATTADQALDTLALKPGQWLLVTGAAGAVGGFAVELAVLRGLRVIAQAAVADEELVRGFGAELFIPRDEHLADTVRSLIPGGADGALDAANLMVAADDAVRHGGAFVSLLNSAPASRREVRTYNVGWHSDPNRLAKLSALAGQNRLTLRVASTYSFDDAEEAHKAQAAGGNRGRIILVP